MQTKLTKLLNIKYPIFQGGLAWISESILASSVSEAGGAGIIGAGGRTGEWVREEIRKTKARTNKPFGVNIVLMESNKDEIVQVVSEEMVSFVTFGAGNPIPYFDVFKSKGIKVIPVVFNVRLAKKVEASGADAIIIEGMEAGGHVGVTTSMALLTQVIPEVSIPVISAGGIADGRGMAAALLMGASGVQMGSRFLVSEECQVHPKYKQRIIDAVDTDSIVTGYGMHHAVRGLKNPFTTKFIELQQKGASQEELDNFAIGTYKMGVTHGDIENGMVCAGQSLMPLKTIEPVKDIIESIYTEAIQTLKNAWELIQ